MTRNPIEAFERMLAAGRDGVLLRYGLASELAKAGRHEDAVVHLRRAVASEPKHSASWKLLGKSLATLGRPDEALAAYEEGIRIANANGDLQAMKEMQVFARRLRPPS